jgi:small-conductance mechanosensitive channel
LEEEFPNKIIIDNNIKNAFRKALETIEITRGVKFRYI